MKDVLLSIPIVRAGFPSPADEYLEASLDYNRYFQCHKASVLSVRVHGDSMKGSHIPHNAIVVIDRGIKPVNNSIVVATVNGETVIKHYVRTQSGHFLVPANDKYPSLRITEEMDFAIWGTAKHVIIDL